MHFLPLPEVMDYRLPHEGVAHNLLLAKIKKEYPGQGKDLLVAETIRKTPPVVECDKLNQDSRSRDYHKLEVAEAQIPEHVDGKEGARYICREVDQPCVENKTGKVRLPSLPQELPDAKVICLVDPIHRLR